MHFEFLKSDNISKSYVSFCVQSKLLTLSLAARWRLPLAAIETPHRDICLDLYARRSLPLAALAAACSGHAVGVQSEFRAPLHAEFGQTKQSFSNLLF